MGLSVLEIILDLQSDYYKKYNRAVSTVVMNLENYKYLTRELEVERLDNLHGMQIVIRSDRKIALY